LSILLSGGISSSSSEHKLTDSWRYASFPLPSSGHGA
jgi:hypothetical protein